jgi:hypothetical protein
MDGAFVSAMRATTGGQFPGMRCDVGQSPGERQKADNT